MTNPTTTRDWPTVDRLARRQHGLITQVQLAAAGFTPSMVRTARADGRLTAMHPGVYRTVGARSTFEQRVLAATLRAGPPAAASCRSGAHLWGLHRAPDRVEITIPYATRRRPRNVVLHRSADFDPNQFTVRSGIPVTKPARTIVDLAAVVAVEETAEIVDRALVRGLVSSEGLRVAVAELARPGRSGPAVVRHLLDDHPSASSAPNRWSSR